MKRFSIAALCLGILLVIYGLGALVAYGKHHVAYRLPALFVFVPGWSLILMGRTGLLTHKILDRLPRNP